MPPGVTAAKLKKFNVNTGSHLYFEQPNQIYTEKILVLG